MRKQCVLFTVMLVLAGFGFSGCATKLATDLGGAAGGFRAARNAMNAEASYYEIQQAWAEELMKNPSANMAAVIVGDRVVIVYKGEFVNASSHPLIVSIVGRIASYNIRRIEPGQRLTFPLPEGSYKVTCRRLNLTFSTRQRRAFVEDVLTVDSSPEDSTTILSDGTVEVWAWNFTVMD